MKFLLIIIIILVSQSGLIWYITNTEFFRPYLESGDVNIINVLIFLTLVSSLGGELIALIVFIGEKFLYCGRKEFPKCTRAVKFGFIGFLCLLLLLILHVFHFLNFWIALILIIFVIMFSIIIT
jgi:hypothetical protein